MPQEAAKLNTCLELFSTMHSGQRLFTLEKYQVRFDAE
jgi:hypothetical protein